MSTDIEFFFNFSSPYGYFASFKADDLVQGTGRRMLFKPVMIGVAFQATGNLPLAEQPIKGDYCRHDWERMGRLMEVPWVLPDPFPIATLAAARAFYWLDDHDPGLAKRFARAVFDAYFGEGRDVSAVEAVAEVAAPLGVEADALIDAVQAPPAKQRLRHETDDAIARGVIGSPYFMVDGEGFWGSDRLWMIRRWIKSGGW
jgi:2-hydroxychromene-2-carboxylate isomerase